MGCQGSGRSEPMNETIHEASKAKKEHSWRYLALGDSYTIGEGITEEGRWPNQLVDTLQSLMPIESFEDAEILATTGWTTDELKQAFDRSALRDSQWDMVSLLIGVNDQFDGISLSQYRVDLEAMMERALAAVGQRPDRVFVLSIPNYGHTPYGQERQEAISNALEPFNQACKEISESHGVHYFNITPISEKWPDAQGWIASDGLHPSELQYRAWVHAIISDVHAAIAS